MSPENRIIIAFSIKRPSHTHIVHIIVATFRATRARPTYSTYTQKTTHEKPTQQTKYIAIIVCGAVKLIVFPYLTKIIIKKKQKYRHSYPE